MSATPQRFEGPSIEAVLARVRDELGQDAEIVEANRVRSGGIAGFFARETFEVRAVPASGAHASGGTGADGLLDLVERISAAESGPAADRHPADDPLAPLEPVHDPHAPLTRAQQVVQQVMADHLGVGGPLGARPTDDAAAFQPLLPTEMPRLSTEAPAFSEVLHRIAGDAGPDVAQAVEERLPRPLVPVGPATRMPPPALRSEQDMTRTERLMSWLAREHLPRTTLLSALRGLPQMEALPAAPGVVVAVVGDRQRALKLARQMARACDADPSAVVLASAAYRGSAVPAAQRIVDLTEAVAERRSWRRREVPTFVAVDSPASPRADRQAFARGVIAALDAHRVIGIVPAGRKNDDIRTWADAVGGVDGLALVAVEETTTPHEVLALEIPVAYLDDEPATPGTWAHALLDGAAA